MRAVGQPDSTRESGESRRREAERGTFPQAPAVQGNIKGKSTLMIYDRHPNLQNKCNKAFWARGYYVATIGNETEDAIKKYITEQSEEARKEDSEGAAF